MSDHTRFHTGTARKALQHALGGRVGRTSSILIDALLVARCSRPPPVLCPRIYLIIFLGLSCLAVLTPSLTSSTNPTARSNTPWCAINVSRYRISSGDPSLPKPKTPAEPQPEPEPGPAAAAARQYTVSQKLPYDPCVLATPLNGNEHAAASKTKTTTHQRSSTPETIKTMLRATLALQNLEPLIETQGGRLRQQQHHSHEADGQTSLAYICTTHA